MADKQPKAVRHGYAPAAFFFAQTSEKGDVRLVAWTPSLMHLRRALESLIRQLPDNVEVLLKIRVEEEPVSCESQRWTRYHGVVAQGALLEAIVRCETFVFQDSRNQLCVRDPVTFDYVVLDDVGVLYIYSNEEVFRRVLTKSCFEEREEALITDEGCWAQTPPDGVDQEREFVRLLRLTAVAGPDEVRDLRSLH